MLQNSLDRIFAGLATSLREDVLPAVADPYARAQVLAAVEVLGNLGERVEWRSADLREEIERVRELLPSPPAVDGDLVASHRAHLEALAQAQADGTVPPEPLRAYLAWQLERDLARLRTGMYKG